MKAESAAEWAVAVMVLRRLRGWNQQELADASGVNRVLISLFESGKRRPSARTLERLLAASSVPLSTFQVLLSHLRLAAAGQEELRTGGGQEGEDASLAVRAALRSARTEVLSAVAAREPESPESARRQARESWARLKAYSPRDRRVLVDGALEYQRWALRELVCAESRREAGSDPSLSIELAELAQRITERMAGEREEAAGEGAINRAPTTDLGRRL